MGVVPLDKVGVVAVHRKGGSLENWRIYVSAQEQDRLIHRDAEGRAAGAPSRKHTRHDRFYVRFSVRLHGRLHEAISQTLSWI
jgi:hypothetical protein